MLIKQAHKLLELRQILLLVLVVLGILLSTNVVQRRVFRTCPAPPSYRPDVPAQIRAELDYLHAHQLLYCASARDLAAVKEPVYWGSDGMNSVLFFQPEDLRGIGIVEYSFGSDRVPTPPGDARLPGFELDVAGRQTFENQAPAGASYFYRREGAPAEVDGAVRILIRGPAVTNPGLSGRNFFRDLDLLVSFLRRVSSSERHDTRTLLAIPISPVRWERIPHRAINPQLAGTNGQISTAVLVKIGDALQEPTLYQTVTGPWASTVWVAGVLSATNPSLVLAPIRDGSGQEIEPVATGLWVRPGKGGMRLKHFAFPPLPTDGLYEGRYWSDPKRRATARPDLTWRIQFPAAGEPAATPGSD